MCGITGFLSRNNRLAESDTVIAAMTERLHHRGPDDGGVWLSTEDGLALGHRRLSIIDLSPHGHQPMHSQCGRYVIVYNGEVYNYLELQRQLIAKGHRFTGHSDTEVILALIVEYGIESALMQMSGMFAFALWDTKEKLLHLARDRIGEKPLYYGMVNSSFVFGSELKTLRAYPDFHNAICRGSLSLLLQYGYIPAPHSIYENIYKLMPGTYLTISKSNLNHLPAPITYWSAVNIAKEGLANPLILSDTEAILQADSLLSNIIKSRMISDVPIGAFLSGGIDSSVVTALMQANSSRPIKTFTIGFNEKAYNEAEYAKAVANHLKTEHTELYVDSAQALAIIPKLPEIYDEPFADSSAIPTFLVSQLTRQHVTVCLSGDGGDEVFGGYNRYLLGKNIWKKLSILPHPVRVAMQKLLLSVSPAKWDKLLKFMPYPIIGDKLHKLASVVAVKSPELLYNHLISQWKNADSVVINAMHSHANNDCITLLNQFGNWDFVDKMMVTDTISYLPDDIMVKVDRAGMAVSLESRAPYLDHHLIEFMWKLPLDMKIRNGETKWLLRQVLAKHIPNHLIDRQKMGFGVPLDSWLRGPLREWAANLLNKNILEKQGFFHPEPILQKWQEHLSGKRNWQYPLWTILMFQAWLGNMDRSSR